MSETENPAAPENPWGIRARPGWKRRRIRCRCASTAQTGDMLVGDLDQFDFEREIFARQVVVHVDDHFILID